MLCFVVIGLIWWHVILSQIIALNLAKLTRAKREFGKGVQLWVSMLNRFTSNRPLTCPRDSGVKHDDRVTIHPRPSGVVWYSDQLDYRQELPAVTFMIQQWHSFQKEDEFVCRERERERDGDGERCE